MNISSEQRSLVVFGSSDIPTPVTRYGWSTLEIQIVDQIVTPMVTWLRLQLPQTQ